MMVIWLILVSLLGLAMFPLGVRICYNEAGFDLKVIAWLLKITVFPRKKKGKKEKKPKKTGSGTKQKAVDKQSQKKTTEPPESKPEQNRTEGSMTRFLPFVRLGLKFLGDFQRKIRLDNLYLRLILAGDDPCDLAVNYGRAWAAAGNLMSQLERLFVIKRRDIQVECDFTVSETRLDVRLDITITFGRLVILAVHYGLRVLVEYFGMKKKAVAQNE